MLENLWELSKDHTAVVGVIVAAVTALSTAIGVFFGPAISALWRRWILPETGDGNSGLKIPLEGDYGPNLLSGNVETADTDRNYSLAAEAPDDHAIRVRVSAPNASTSQSNHWTRSVASVVGWKSGELDEEDMGRDHYLPPGEHGDVQLNFLGSGTLKLELFKHDQGSPDREIEVDWE